MWLIDEKNHIIRLDTTKYIIPKYKNYLKEIIEEAKPVLKQICRSKGSLEKEDNINYTYINNYVFMKLNEK